MRDTHEVSHVNKNMHSVKSTNSIMLSNLLKQDEDGRNVLLQAVVKSDLGVVKKLLRHVELYTGDVSGNTPFHLAALHSHEPIVDYLIDHKPLTILLVRNKQKRTALSFMQEKGLVSSVRKLLKKIEQVTHHHIEYKDIVLLRCAIQNGLNTGNLTTLDLSSLSITDDFLASMMPDFVNHPNRVITHFSLQQNLLTHKSMEVLVELLRDDKKLRVLNLEGNKLGHPFSLFSGIRSLTNALKKNNSLTTLILSHCHLNDSDVEVLTTLLRQNSSLSELRLEGNPRVTRKAWAKLLANLSHYEHGLITLTINEEFDYLLQEQNILNPDVSKEIMIQSQHPSDLFLDMLNDLCPPVDSEKILDDATKEKLLKKREENTLTSEEVSSLFREIVREQRAAYQQSPISAKEAFLHMQGELQWLVTQNTHYLHLKNTWDKQKNKLRIDEVKNIQAKSNLEQHFQTVLQHKLSLYWLAAGCLETKLIPAAQNEVEQTLKRLNIIIGLLSLLPVISESHHIAHGLLGMFEKMYEFMHEVMESLEFVEFISELPVVHQVFHRLAKEMNHFKTISQEEMIDNVGQGFADWEICIETCQSIAKAITYRFEGIMKLDSRGDATKLSEFTAHMILDFYKMGCYRGIENQSELVEAILDWLFYSSQFYYKDKKQPHVSVVGKRYTVTEFYTKSSLVFFTKDNQQKLIHHIVDMLICDHTHHEMVRTHSPILTRKGSKKEAEGLKQYLQTQRENKGAKEKMSVSRYVTFFPKDKLVETANDIRAFEFTFKTKSQRLKNLEETVIEQENKIEVLLEDVARFSVQLNQLKEKQKQLENRLEKKDSEILNKFENEKNEMPSQPTPTNNPLFQATTSNCI